MEATAVNPQLQSAILDKFGNPFGQATQKIVENMDLTVDKQEVLVEKQDTVNDKVKQVINKLDGAGDGMSNALGRASDGIKELSFGMIDLKGIFETVSNKLSALGDIFAPLAEIGSFLAVTGVGTKIKDTLTPTKTEEEESKDFDKQFTDMLNGLNGGDAKEDKLPLAERLQMGFTNFFTGLKTMFKNLRTVFGKAITAIRTFTATLFTGILAFLPYVAIVAAATFGLVKLVQALGGWELLSKAINGLRTIFGNLKMALNSIVLWADGLPLIGGFLGEEGKQQREEYNRNETNRQTLQDEKDKDKARVKEIMADESIGSIEDRKALIQKEGLVTQDSTVNAQGQIMSADGKVLVDTKENISRQADLDYLALRSQMELPGLMEDLANAKDKDKAKIQASIDAARNFIDNYNKTYGEGAAETAVAGFKRKGDIQKFIRSKNDSIDRREFNDANANFKFAVANAQKSGDVIKEQTIETGESALLRAGANREAIANVMAPNIITNATNQYQLAQQSNVDEGISK